MLQVFSEIPGPPFWFFAMVGLLTLFVAARFAFRPLERTLAVLRPLCAATAAAALGAFFAGVTNGLAGLKHGMEAAGSAAVHPAVIVGGASEALVTLVLGAAILAVAWLLTAVGFHRQA
jgi:uncharacterized membrane protein